MLSLPAKAAEMVDTQVSRHPEQPVMAALNSKELPGALCHSQERFLDDVLGRVVVAKKVRHKAKQRGLVSLQENTEAFGIA